MMCWWVSRSVALMKALADSDLDAALCDNFMGKTLLCYRVFLGLIVPFVLVHTTQPCLIPSHPQSVRGK